MTLVYPTLGEYISALRNAPEKRFADDLLRRLRFEKKGHTLDFAVGGLAIVFKTTDPATSDRYALRCFKGHSEERLLRYSEISNFLDARKALLPFIVRFRFFAEEIRIKSAQGLPVILMQWVEGSLLKQWIQARCDGGDKARLLNLAEKWRQMIAVMRSLKLAHGDLQHGNIMVNDKDEFILIDYDGMAVPNLHGPDSPELGLPGYQHRERISGKSNKLCEDLDNFSAINIFVCLRAIAVDPRVFTRFGDHDEGLLFHPQDLESPDASDKFDQLQALGDPQLTKWVAKLKVLASGPLSNVPSLDQFLCDPQQIVRALDAADWEKAVELADDTISSQLPPELSVRIEKARKAIACRHLLKLAIDAGDERRIADAWIEEVFRNYPAARTLSDYASKAKQVFPIVDQLAESLKKQDGRKAVAIWDKNQSLLSGRSSAKTFASQIENWRKRNELADRAILLLKSAGNVLVPDLVNVADQLEKLGGHPDIITQVSFVAIVQRNRLAQKLLHLSCAETAENDGCWIDSWDQQLLSGFPPVTSLESHYTQARGRYSSYKSLSSAIAATKASSLTEESQIVSLACSLPVNYCQALTNRSEVAKKRLAAVNEAAKACQSQGLIHEATLVAAMERVRHADAASLLQSADRARLILAEKRIPILQQLASVPRDDSMESDAKILSLWQNEHLLDGCDDAKAFRKRYESALERSRLLTQLQQAKDSGDHLAVRDLALSPLLVGFNLDKTMQDAVKLAKQTAATADVMLRQLEADQEVEFARKLDIDSLSQFWPMFAGHQQKIRKWLLNGVLKPDFIGLRMPSLGQPIQRINAVIRLKWHFPARVTQKCLITFSRGQTESAADLETPRVVFRQEVSFRTFEQGGSACTLPVGRFEGASVCVWAVLDVAGEQFYSAPLKLGRISAN